MTSTALAHPYASSLTNNAGTVSFRLNETNASVVVIGNLGTLTNDLGTFPGRGLVITNLTGSGMTGGVFQVVVTKPGSGAPTLISDNTSSLLWFYSPRGVAVNKRAASPYFGRIYVANALPGTTTVPGSRTTGDGMYLLNADGSDAVGQGNTVRTAGIDMVITSSAMPWRVRVGEDDDMLYLCDWTDTTGNLFRTDPDVSASSGTNVLQVHAGPLVGTGTGLDPSYIHGSIAEVYVTGTLGGGDLTVYTADEDYETNPGFLAELNSLWRYDIGSGPLPWSNAPNAKIATPSVAWVGQTMGLDRGTNGYWYLLDSRFYGNENVLQVIDPSGPTVVYESRTESLGLGFTYDYLSNSVSVAVSPDMLYCAVMRGNGRVVVMPMVSGIPSLAGRTEFTSGATAGTRQIVFDAADNLYIISSSNERLQVWSLGLTTTATTGSDGTFGMTTPATTVSVTVNTNTVYEAGPTTAILTITRANDPLTLPLTVSFSMGGTATRGTDYVLQTNSVTFTGTTVIIPASGASVNVSLVASNDTVAELTETAVFNVLGGVGYSATAPVSQTVAIVDDETPMADLAVIQGSMYERLTNDYVRLRVVRRGNTNVATFTVNLAYTGTATASVDYTPVASVNIDPGVVNQNFDLTPLNDSLLEGSETISCTVTSGTGYVVGTNTPSVNATIVDDELPPETVLFSENFNTDNSANWTVRFGSGNGIDDYRYTNSVDYGAGNSPVPAAIPPAPRSTSDTLGAFLVVNKDDGTAEGAAGINLYPNSQSFSGNYAVRFDMYFFVNSGGGTTEYALFGINHSGNNTNWHRNSAGGVPAGWTFDGLFYSVESDAAALGDYVIYSAPNVNNNPTALTPGVNASTLTGTFKSGVFAYPGAPANLASSTTPSWTDVEVSQIGQLITLKINNTLIMRYTNSTAFTNGNIMLGYIDGWDSIGNADSGVVYDNLRVVALAINITKIEIVGANAEVTFTFGIDEPTTAFRLQSSSTVGSGYADAGAATIAKLSPGVYKATIATSGSGQFYRVRYAGP